MPRKVQTIESLLEKTILDPITKCRLWQGAKLKDGYGSASYKNKNYRVHRLMYKLIHGFVPDDMNVLHKCDRPLCIEPTHLFIGTTLDNIVDKMIKNRQSKGEKCFPYILTEEKVRKIRELKRQGVKIQSIAEIMGCTQQNISLITLNKIWRHIT